MENKEKLNENKNDALKKRIADLDFDAKLNRSDVDTNAVFQLHRERISAIEDEIESQNQAMISLAQIVADNLKIPISYRGQMLIPDKSGGNQ